MDIDASLDLQHAKEPVDRVAVGGKSKASGVGSIEGKKASQRWLNALNPQSVLKIKPDLGQHNFQGYLLIGDRGSTAGWVGFTCRRYCRGLA